MAGHSHWNNIKRTKGANDAKRAKIWGKIARKIIVAARHGGGDPAANLALRYVCDEARAANMPKDTIAKAIAKGTGELGGENYEEVIYEGYGPAGVAMMVETLTNNRQRTAPDLRSVFDRHGGNLGANGSVAFQFEKKGVITIRSELIEEEQLFELALEAGAEDVKNEGEVYEVLTEVADYAAVKDAIDAAGIDTEASQLANLPQNTVELDEADAGKVMKLIEALEDNEDVQNVWHNAEMPEGVAS